MALLARYRIAQEAISNAIRHGKARRVGSRSPGGETHRLQVRDDGAGLPKDVTRAQGMGLRIMQYRATMIGGALTVQREPGGGTSVAGAGKDIVGVDVGGEKQPFGSSRPIRTRSPHGR